MTNIDILGNIKNKFNGNRIIMKISDFEIEKPFFGPAGFKWLCTDKGSRVITAIMLEYDKEDCWFKGPPYSLEEKVFDEYEMQSCYNNTQNMILERVGSIETSNHPHFLAEDMFKMFKEKDRNYPRKKLLKRDRTTQEGYILHPYAASKEKNEWCIKVFELFSREFSEMHENEFVKLLFATEENLKNRKESFNKEKKDE